MPDDSTNKAIDAVEHTVTLVVAKDIDALKSTADRFLERGHQVINESLAGARHLAATYPVVGALLPVIEQSLRNLLQHLIHPDLSEPAPVQEPPAPPPAPTAEADKERAAESTLRAPAAPLLADQLIGEAHAPQGS